MRLNCFLLLMLSGLFDTVHGQDVLKSDSLNRQLNAEYLKLYQENSPLSYTSPLSELGAPSKYLLSGRLTTTYMLVATKKLPIALAIQPDFTVRVRTEKSAGVRTPSFKLGGILYYRLPGTEKEYRYLSLSYTHHSNGQDGDALNPDGTINTINGNFTTNYLSLAYHFGRQYRAPGLSDYSLNHSASLKIGKWFGYERALENDYGFTRIGYGFSWRKYEARKEQWRLNAELNYAVNQMSAYDMARADKRLNTELSFHYALPFMSNVFLMATAGYYGEDPYNIYYQDRYAFVRFGISTGFLRQNN